jgi:NAD(P)-dependent dehydrogenase (short-subunit alcohol dehydrogenase family)
MVHQSLKSAQRDTLFDLTGRVALVTGGGSGIGLMIAQAFAVNGAKVYITARTKEKLDNVVNTYGKDIAGELIAVTCDVTKKQSISELYDYISSREKCLCILVNNAGIAGSTLDAETKERSADELKARMFNTDKSTFEDWADVHLANVASAYFMTAAFLPLLHHSTERHKEWSGTVINISSVSGEIKTGQNHFSYNSSKAGLVHLTRMLAGDIAANGLKIRVNSISPGLFPSEMTTGESGEDQKSHLPKARGGKYPAERPGKDDDMFSAVLFCAVNQFANGQNFTVDGGMSLVAGY